MQIRKVCKKYSRYYFCRAGIRPRKISNYEILYKFITLSFISCVQSSDKM